MTYVTEQTPAELRAHMRRLKRMDGWYEPLADRLWREIEALDAALERAESSLALALKALEEISDGHVPDQPAESPFPELVYVKRWVGRLRGVASDALTASRSTPQQKGDAQ